MNIQSDGVFGIGSVSGHEKDMFLFCGTFEKQMMKMVRFMNFEDFDGQNIKYIAYCVEKNLDDVDIIKGVRSDQQSFKFKKITENCSDSKE